jgi:chromosome segregation and condensation protein ScpB
MPTISQDQLTACDHAHATAKAAYAHYEQLRDVIVAQLNHGASVEPGKLTAAITAYSSVSITRKAIEAAFGKDVLAQILAAMPTIARRYLRIRPVKKTTGKPATALVGKKAPKPGKAKSKTYYEAWDGEDD